jgi:hypothetical protein
MAVSDFTAKRPETAVVWKHELLPGRNLVKLRGRARPLSVAHTSEGAFLWTLEEADEPEQERLFVVANTGDTLEYPIEELFPVGTFMLPQAEWVYHVFEWVANGQV